MSRPVRLAVLHEVIRAGRSVLDYGCGRGDDVAALEDAGLDVQGWDPQHRPDGVRRRSDVVNLGFVINVIEDEQERRDVLTEAWRLADTALVVSARLEHERDEGHIVRFRDGWMTGRGTFQRFYRHDELGAWIDETLETRSVAAAPGIFYVFRDRQEREAFLASRFRRPVRIPTARPSDEAFVRHRELLEPLIEFVALRGRLPVESELPDASQLVTALGSIRRAFRIVLWVTEAEEWDRIRAERTADVLVHLALAKFHGRPRFGDLPEEVQRDVRALLGAYKTACGRADRLLFAAGDPMVIALHARASTVGKMTGNALYVHDEALHRLPAVLRVYEGCARAYVGTIEGANVVKLLTGKPQVSYLSYPDFDADPHPALHSSVAVDLARLDVEWREFAERTNPPILHRKELFVSSDYPGRQKFVRLTQQEERYGLYDDPSTIGTRAGWSDALSRAGVALRGHRVVRTTHS
jgi:DNA phosphorothioation-associated putative methyltransferase